jgi:hypothetical protein
MSSKEQLGLQIIILVRWKALRVDEVTQGAHIQAVQ